MRGTKLTGDRERLWLSIVHTTTSTGPSLATWDGVRTMGFANDVSRWGGTQYWGPNLDCTPGEGAEMTLPRQLPAVPRRGEEAGSAAVLCLHIALDADASTVWPCTVEHKAVLESCGRTVLTPGAPEDCLDGVRESKFTSGAADDCLDGVTERTPFISIGPEVVRGGVMERNCGVGEHHCAVSIADAPGDCLTGVTDRTLDILAGGVPGLRDGVVIGNP